MTVSSTTTRNSYSGNGSTTIFAYNFKVFDENDLTVILRNNATATETVQTLTTHYSVSNVGNANGGNVTFVSAPATGITVVIRRTSAQTQTTDYTPNDPFPAESHEDALDKITFIAQEIQEELDRAIKISRTNTMTSTEFTVGSADRANKVLAFDSSGEIAVTQELGTYKGNWAASTDYYVRDLIKDTTNNNIYICNTAHTSSGSQPITTNTDSAKWTLIVDAAAASSSASAAAASASASASSASASATSASNASTSETNAASSASSASSSASSASSSASAATTAQAAAEAALDTFTDQYLGAAGSDPTTDLDGNALTDGDLYFDTTNNVMKVYDLGTTTWKQLTPTAAQQTNIDTVAGISSDVTSVAGVSGDVTTVAGNVSNVGTVAGSISNVNLVGADIAAVINASNNLSDINAFADTYFISATAPSSPTLGDLWFDTTNDIMKVYSSSGFVNAGSSVNGTANRYVYTATSGQTSFAATYDAGYVDVYLNGVKLQNGTDFTATDGANVVLTVGAALNDQIDIVGYGTFNIAIPDISGDATPQLGGDLATSGNNINFGDNDKATFGDAVGGDLQIYHDGGSSWVSDVGAGNLKISSDGAGVFLQKGATEFMGEFLTDGAVRLYYDNAAKFETTATGVDVTGGLNTTGNVGIGSTSPDTNLDVERSSNDTGGIKVQNTNNTQGSAVAQVEISGGDNAYANLLLECNATNHSIRQDGSGNLKITNGSTERFRIDASGNAFMKTANSYIAGTTSLGFYGDAASSNGMFINSSGNVGIGTSSPTLALDVRGESVFGSGTDGVKLTYSAGNSTGIIDTGFTSTGLEFRTGNSFAAKIDSSGNLLVNSTSGAGAAKLVVSADAVTANPMAVVNTKTTASSDYSILFYRAGSIVGSIQTSLSATSYVTSSDYRLKTAVNYDWDATSRLKQLKPARFAWIADGDEAVPVDGFLAHEVQDVVPEAITGTKDGMMDEEYQVSAATGDIYTPAVEATYDEDGVELTAAVDEVIHSADVERPDELAEGQQWRETTAAVMGTRSVPDYQGIDQSKLVPLLVKTIQELEARITALENV